MKEDVSKDTGNHLRRLAEMHFLLVGSKRRRMRYCRFRDALEREKEAYSRLSRPPSRIGVLEDFLRDTED